MEVEISHFRLLLFAFHLECHRIEPHLLDHREQSVGTGGRKVFFQSDSVDEVQVGVENLLRGMSGKHADKQRDDAFHDDRIAISLEDNLPNTIMEAMACGTPCVGFATGGIPEMIDHLHNCYVAGYKSASDIAKGIKWMLFQEPYEGLSQAAVRKVRECYGERAVARRYIEVYNKSLST